jgi:hypothetical protein
MIVCIYVRMFVWLIQVNEFMSDCLKICMQ